MKYFLSFLLIVLLCAGGYRLYTTQISASNNASKTMSMNTAIEEQVTLVDVEVIEPRSVKLWKEYSARLEAVNYAEIRPQISGIITQVNFEDGEYVQKGRTLYQIDSKPFSAIVARVNADLDAAKNELMLSKKELERARKLVEVDAISRNIYDARYNAVQTAQARVQSIKAQLQQARINLDYTNIKAPINGKVGRAEVKVGNLVNMGANAPLLTTVISIDSIYADFEVDENTYINEVRQEAHSHSGQQKIPVRLSIADNQPDYEGYIHSFDNRIDSQSGTIRARALFQNKTKALLPGMFANIKMGGAVPHNYILVPERAIGTDQDRRFVYIVNAENRIAIAGIKTGSALGNERIVLDGLSSGDKVITDGIIRLRPDMLVNPNIINKNAPNDSKES